RRDLVEMRIVAVGNQLVEGFGMAVYGIKIAPFVIREPKWIYPSEGSLPGEAAIGEEPECILRKHDQGIPSFGIYPGCIGKSMAGMNPPVESTDKIVDHPVGVVVAKGTEQLYGFIHLVVMIGILEIVNIGNTIGDGSVGHGHNPDRNIQGITERSEFVGFPIPVGIFQDHNLIISSSGGCGHGVFGRLCEPEPAPVIELYVHRFPDLGLRSKKGDFKAGWQPEAFPLLFGSLKGGAAYMFLITVFGQRTIVLLDRTNTSEH